MTTPRELPSAEPPLEFGQPKDYRHISQQEVTNAFDALHVNPSQRLITEVYIKDNSAVGIFPTDLQMCKGHLENQPIVRGVEHITAMHQTDLLLLYFMGRIQNLLSYSELKIWSLNGIQFVDPVFPSDEGTLLNVGVVRGVDSARALIQRGPDYKVAEGHLKSSDSPSFPVKVATGKTPISEPLPYREVRQQETRDALAGFGYGPSKMFVTRLLIGENETVGILRIDSGNASQSFGFSQANMIEALGQTLLLGAKERGELGEGMSPRFAELIRFNFDMFVPFPGTEITMVVKKGEGMSGQGKVFCGDVLLGEGDLKGVVLKSAVAERLGRSALAKMTASQPLFLPQG